MNELSTQVNNEWFTAKQVATEFHIDVKSIRKLFLRYEPQLGENLRKIKSGGRTGFTTYINKNGVIILLNLKDSRRNINSKSVNDATDASLQGKKKIAEIAIAKVKQVDLSDLLQQMEQLRMAVQEVKTLSLGVPSGDITDGQREFLNERVRYYASMTGVSHSWVWKRIHGFVGKSGIEAYRFNDYKPAYRYLKDMYNAAKLNWN